MFPRKPDRSCSFTLTCAANINDVLTLCRRLLININTAIAITARKTTPPTTPPAAAAVEEDAELLADAVGLIPMGSTRLVSVVVEVALFKDEIVLADEVCPVDMADAAVLLVVVVLVAL